MIEVRNLSKEYGAVRAIGGIDFDVSPGEVLGLLGPNGAGKTTTMRIVCGCIGATTGVVRIGGDKVTEHPERVKRKVGYLPEIPPLYASMTVGDFVRFAATIKGVSDPDAATTSVLAQVGLDGPIGGRLATERIIGLLSKGYQQRVGLAQALVHEPEVLVLDEPTSGLDPAQRKEIRDLLLNLAQTTSRTVILSTHVLADVEAICNRVVVIDKGRIVAKDTLADLKGGSGRVHIELSTPVTSEIEMTLLAVPGVVRVTATGGGHLIVETDGDIRADVARATAPMGLLALSQDQTLEDIYLQLTGART